MSSGVISKSASATASISASQVLVLSALVGMLKGATKTENPAPPARAE
jgi:hypothetical protein